MSLGDAPLSTRAQTSQLMHPPRRAGKWVGGASCSSEPPGTQAPPWGVSEHGGQWDRNPPSGAQELSHSFRSIWVRRMDRFPEPRRHMQRLGVHPKSVLDTRDSALVLPVLDLRGWSPSLVRTLRTRSPPSSGDSSVSIQASSLYHGSKGRLSETAEGLPCPSWALTWDPAKGWKTQQLKRKR